MSDLVHSMRPKNFEDMIGMDKLVHKIRGRFKKHRVPKAFLFTGQTGNGKTTVSRILAVSLQCRHNEFGVPCNKCYSQRSQFNILEINASDFTGIDALRAILDGYTHAPMPGSRRRVYILDELHQLSKHSQNLLLKFTEDSPRTTVWIGCTTEPDKLLRTLRRRFTIYPVPSLGLDDVKRLVKRGLKISHSDKSSGDLIERLMEKSVSSPGLILKAVSKYADEEDCTAEEAANVELTTDVDTLSLCNALRKGDWDSISKYLDNANKEDALSIKSSIQGYLKAILLGDKEFSKRTDIVADGILKLHMVRDELPSISAVLYKLAKDFSRYKR